jgi:ABC-type transporter Mla maintaining outer membrane lipid asymmetry ATPase subunit MlaF
LERSRNGTRPDFRTTFLVLQEGRLIFEGDQDRLEASKDPYVLKFVRRRE